MKFFTLKQHILNNLFLCLFSLTMSLSAKDNTIQYSFDNLTVDLGGRFTNESYNSSDLTFLNRCIPEDNLFYLRTTFDFYTTFTQGDYQNPRLVFYDTLRFRFKWGSVADVKNSTSSVKLSQTSLSVKGTATNKHLLWMRESWLKLYLGNIEKQENFIQIGLIPFEVGRGISLGAAYDSTGFLGFNPSSSVEQYAPSVLLSVNPIEDRFFVDMYLALLENHQTSLSENLEKIYSNAVDNACTKRGVGKQSYIAALRSKIVAIKTDYQTITFEPYIVYQHAPDQDLEFVNDIASYLSTVGFAVEGSGPAYSWGFEAARNFGEYDVLAWDRNYTQLVNDGNGNIVEQFTRVYTQNPADYINPNPAPNSTAAAALVYGCPQTVASNGQEIGTITIDSVPVTLWNAFHRFRPFQIRTLEGYFFIADAIYEMIPKVFNAAVGVGYASGYTDEQRDTNLLSQQELLNEKYTGFVPIQSVYSGKRLRHLVLFNEGVPRFGTRLPNADVSKKNVTSIIAPGVVNKMTDIAFVGIRLNCSPPVFAKNKLNIGQNIIAYWAPETSSFVVMTPAQELFYEENIDNPVALRDANFNTLIADHYLGLELSTEFSALVYEKVKISGYFGFFIPGQHYRDMAETLISPARIPTGSDIGLVGNFGVSYFF